MAAGVGRFFLTPPGGLTSCPATKPPPLLFGQKVRIFSHQQASSPPPRAAGSSRKLILYSKPGCCLCDNLKEKLEAVFLKGGANSLSDIQLEIRDISKKPEWESAYQYEIPVLARLNEDNSETVLPRVSPRLTVEVLQKKLSALYEVPRQ